MTVVTPVVVGGACTCRAIKDRAAIVRRVAGKAVEGQVTRQTHGQPRETRSQSTSGGSDQRSVTSDLSPSTDPSSLTTDH
jgi:hypothetical protein